MLTAQIFLRRRRIPNGMSSVASTVEVCSSCSIWPSQGSIAPKTSTSIPVGSETTSSSSTRGTSTLVRSARLSSSCSRCSASPRGQCYRWCSASNGPPSVLRWISASTLGALLRRGRTHHRRQAGCSTRSALRPRSSGGRRPDRRWLRRTSWTRSRRCSRTRCLWARRTITSTGLTSWLGRIGTAPFISGLEALHC
jgi:hypothetical protein